MNVTVVSSFRNAAHYIERYCRQMDDFQRLLNEKGHALSLILGYGDSTDGTGEILFKECQGRFQATLVDVTHGGGHYGSVVHPQRFKQLAGIGNKLWSHIAPDTHYVALVESDLLWYGSQLINLLDAVQMMEKVKSFGFKRFIVAPLVLHKDGRFYDTWAFRKNKIHFLPEPPFHRKLDYDGRYTDMDSVGSCFVMTYNLVNLVSWPEKDVVVGFCREAVEKHGAEIYLDRESVVYHE